jgi:type II secretory pathway pseudopilin PulG
VLPATPPVPEKDVYAAAQIRNLRTALELYRREHGSYPDQLEDLVKDRWIVPDQARVAGYVLRYRPPKPGSEYKIDLQPDR